MENAKSNNATTPPVDFRSSEEGPLVYTMTVKVSERMKSDFEAAAEKSGASVPEALRAAIALYASGGARH